MIKGYGIQIIHGRPRHPQSQGLIEQANGVLKQKFRAWMAQTGLVTWERGLSVITMAMNSGTPFIGLGGRTGGRGGRTSETGGSGGAC